MINSHKEEAALKEENRIIWIPSFTQKHKIQISLDYNIDNKVGNDISLIYDLKNTHVENSIYNRKDIITNIDQYYNSNLAFDNEYSSNPKLHPRENDIVLNDSFLLSLINIDSLENTSLSTVFLTIVEKEHWNTDN